MFCVSLLSDMFCVFDSVCEWFGETIRNMYGETIRNMYGETICNMFGRVC